MVKNALLLYYELISIYKTEYNQVFESKDEGWRKKHDYKNLKDLNYQADKADVTEKAKKDEDESDQKLPPWASDKRCDH